MNIFCTIIFALFFCHVADGADEPAYYVEIPGTATQRPAIKYYPLTDDSLLSTNERATTADNLPIFTQEIDKVVFSPNNNKKIKGLAIAGAFIGASLVASPSCGYIMANVADFLGIPVSSAFSKGTIAWIVLFATPGFKDIWYKISKTLGYRAFKGPGFTYKGHRNDSRPHIITKNRYHTTLDALLFISASISAAVPTALMHVAEKDFPAFFYTTAVPFYLTWLTTYFYEASCNLDQYFQNYLYLGETTQYKKRILQQKIDLFKLALYDNDALVNESFGCIKQGRENNFSPDEGNPFVFSCLLLKNINRADPQVSRGGVAPLLNFRMDMENVRPSWGPDMLKWFSTFSLGLGTYAKFFITQHVLNDAFLALGLEEDDAYTASASLTTFETIFRMVMMKSVQERFLQALPRFHPHLLDI